MKLGFMRHIMLYALDLTAHLGLHRCDDWARAPQRNGIKLAMLHTGD
jgi:hypothetical protein